MNKKYVIHPGDYAIGENEKLYSDMAKSGWMLEKRGRYISRFKKSKTENIKYRIELSKSTIIEDDGGLPEEQIELYEECGWHYVTRKGIVNVFCADSSNAAPEIYTDPEQHAATLKSLRRSYYISLLILLLIAALSAAAAAWGDMDKTYVKIIMTTVRFTAFQYILYIVILWLVGQIIYGGVRTECLYRKLKKGHALDHTPAKHQYIHKTVTAVIWGVIAVLAVLAVVQLVGSREYDMPEEPDGPYILLSDLGWGGSRTIPAYSDKASNVQTTRSLLAAQWDTYECVEASGSEVVLYQDIYKMRSTDASHDFVPWLMKDSLFADGEEDYREVDIDGLDYAYQSAFEYIAVKGDIVYYITYISPDYYETEISRPGVLEALAK